MFKHSGCYYQQTHDWLDASDYAQENKPRGGFAAYGSPEAEAIIARVREANKRKQPDRFRQYPDKREQQDYEI